ncbi:hypothetical protein FA15DRAFT_671045 [Coprinopsis marcescibilis]|uniref:C2H2-type domain-containing protein n=1 Tax=Coprinopsis marcescibilis TaxID=230819 RepID=A0A5C3KRL2_COPMA|nr:hypothetical protein FA15DRAFT_671045 [Coprinopsis marcescibilis]
MESPSSSKSVSLPSIHEMFPEHLMGSNEQAGGSSTSRRGSQDSSSKVGQSPVSQHGTHRPLSRSSVPQATTKETSQPSRDHSFSPSSRARTIYSRNTEPTSSRQHRGSSETTPAFRVSSSGTPPPSAPTFGAGGSPRRPRESTSLPAELAGMKLKDRPASTSTQPSIISFPVGSGTAASRQEEAGDPAANHSDDEGSTEPNTGKKHVCPTCFKRFNRPSSLRIHVNTHTGATPFRCPWPNCGREFNVNSNMRRHYRNHTTPGFSRQPNDIRRRRRRLEPTIVDHHPSNDNDHHSLRRVPNEDFVRGAPGAGYGSDESDGYESDYGKPSHELLDYDLHHASYPQHHSVPRSSLGGSSRSSASYAPHPHSQPHSRSHHHQPTVQQYQYPPPAGYYHPHSQSHRESSSRHYASSSHRGSHQYPPQVSPRHHPYPLPSGRPYTPAGSSFHSSSPSPSPSPPPHHHAHAVSHKEPVYSASIPYLRSATQSQVSTTLRPAFGSTTSRISSERSHRSSSGW